VKIMAINQCSHLANLVSIFTSGVLDNCFSSESILYQHRQRGGIGSSAHDARQTDIRAFFKQAGHVKDSKLNRRFHNIDIAILDTKH
jgi:hypothetical protein